MLLRLIESSNGQFSIMNVTTSVTAVAASQHFTVVWLGVLACFTIAGLGLWFILSEIKKYD